MFKITQGKGIHITFENGYTVSIQFGGSNYCDNNDCYEDDTILGRNGSKTAETAVWGPDKKLICLDGDCDSVQGYQSPEEVLALLIWAESQPNKEG